MSKAILKSKNSYNKSNFLDYFIVDFHNFLIHFKKPSFKFSPSTSLRDSYEIYLFCQFTK